MRMLMLGFNHRTAPLELREALAFDPDHAAQLLRALRDRFPTSEAVLLSTCNRTELYLARPADDPPSIEQLRSFIAQAAEVDLDTLAASSIHREQDQAAMHLFRVCAGLDSMVLGEPQILGQVKRAYEHADRHQTVGPILHRLFQAAITAAKQARHQTGIDQGRTSVSSVAVAFARNIFDHFNDKTVLAVGAGEMVKAALISIQREAPKRLLVVNRTHQHALNLADQLGLTGDNHGARPWENLDSLLAQADIVISCTAAAQPIITADRFKPILKKRRNRPLFMLDLAMPRDIEPAVATLRNVYLYNLDDLQNAVKNTQSDRRALAERCENLLEQHVQRCMGEIQHRNVGQLVKQLRQRLHQIASQEQDRTARKLAALNGQSTDQAIAQILQQHNHRLVNKILHLPLAQLDRANPGFYAAALRRLFDLQDPPGLIHADLHPLGTPLTPEPADDPKAPGPRAAEDSAPQPDSASPPGPHAIEPGLPYPASARPSGA